MSSLSSSHLIDIDIDCKCLCLLFLDESNTGGNVECGRLGHTCPRPGCDTDASVPAGAAGASGVNTS